MNIFFGPCPKCGKLNARYAEYGGLCIVCGPKVKRTSPPQPVLLSPAGKEMRS